MIRPALRSLHSPIISSFAPCLSRIRSLHTTRISRLHINTDHLISPPPNKDFNIPEKSPIEEMSDIVKPTSPSDLYVSCTILDGNGNVTAVSKHFPKMRFLQQHGLYPRDLRKIDTSAIDIIPSIVVRDNCILVNLLHIKALLEANKVMIFDTSNPTAASKLGLFVYDLEAKLKAPSTGWVQQYEHRALESILINVMTCLETELQTHLKVCGSIIAELEDQIDRDKLRDLLIKSKSLSMFYQKTLLIRNVLDELLENDDDLSGMYLTEKLEHKNTSTDPVERTDYGEVEMLLEAYYKQCDEFVQQSESLLSDIKATEEIVNIILDANRNSLMLFELKVTIYTLGFTIATLLPAFYGMNLKNFVEESNLGFGGVVIISCLMAFVMTAANFKKLRSVQKLTLMSPGDSKRAKAIRGQKLEARKKSILNHFLFRKKARRRDPIKRDIIWKWLVNEKEKH